MADRYFLDKPITSDYVTLDGSESHHLINVMRVRPGAEVILFDGSGVECVAVVEQVTRNAARLKILSRNLIDRELPLEITLAVALPKGERQKWLIEKAVELGVARFVPLRTQRSVAQPVEQALARLRRTVIEATKQCRRNKLMEICEPEDWAAFLARADKTSCRILAHPHAKGVEHSWPTCFSKGSSVFLAIGPEGGFTDEEVSAAQTAGWLNIDLGPRILRIETAALLMVAMVTARLQQ